MAALLRCTGRPLAALSAVLIALAWAPASGTDIQELLNMLGPDPRELGKPVEGAYAGGARPRPGSPGKKKVPKIDLEDIEGLEDFDINNLDDLMQPRNLHGEQCPYMAPKLRSHLKVQANGCGPKGMRVEESFGLYKCCNRHDVCYSLCSTGFDFCEKDFKKCMNSVCKKHPEDQRAECKAKADSFKGMTGGFGRSFHAVGQRQSCDCFLSKSEAQRRHKEFLRDFYQLHNSTLATDENVEKVLKKYKGKEGDLYYSLALKYGHQFITFDGIKDEL